MEKITADLITITAMVTALAGLLGALVSLYGKSRDALAQLEVIKQRLDDHSRRISSVGEDINRVALQVEPRK